MIALIGANGNMGRRYGAILDHLNVIWEGVDLDTSPEIRGDILRRCHGIMIATPTSTHYEHLREFSKLRKAVFCEKPLTKNMNELAEVCELYEGHSLTMAFQYSELLHTESKGPSHYDYFRHGNDGLIWDCIQIISLARGSVHLEQVSPIWSCAINGQKLNIADMDRAYIDNVKRWLMGGHMDLKLLTDIHQKTAEYENSGT